jgi:hypothetical protein
VIYLASAGMTMALTISPEARRYSEEAAARGESAPVVEH